MATYLRPRAIQHEMRGLFWALCGSYTPAHSYAFNTDPNAVFVAEAFDVQEPPIVKEDPSLSLEDRDSQFFWGDAAPTNQCKECLYECPASPLHATRRINLVFELSLFGGPRVPAFLRHMSPFNVVAEPFAERLSAAGFVGLKLTEWPVVCLDEGLTSPRWFYIEGYGRTFRLPCDVVGGPNACPYCGYGPIVCEVCGQTSTPCPACGKLVFNGVESLKNTPPHPIIIERNSDRYRLHRVDAARWDGSDFTSMGDAVIVTRRVIDWLLASRGGPWMALPLRCELARVRPEQHEALLAAAGSLRGTLAGKLAALAGA